MNTTPLLTSSHQRTREKIFQHPLCHNLAWHDVLSLLARIGHVVAQPNGSHTVTCNGETIVLPPARTKEVGTDDMMKLRHFLQRTAATAPAVPAVDNHFLVVINHHEARVFRTELVEAMPERILPHAPEDFFRHAPHSKDFSRGQEKPEPNSFFVPVARALKDAGHILLFGSGKGMASEMEQLVIWLQAHHPELARRVAGTRIIDEHHLTDAQLLAQARDFYRTAALVR